MTHKEKIEFTFRNMLRVAELEDSPIFWCATIMWCRSKEGGRHPALGRHGDNTWCFQALPEHAMVFAPENLGLNVQV